MALEDILSGVLTNGGRAVTIQNLSDDFSVDTSNSEIIQKYLETSGLPFQEGMTKASPAVVMNTMNLSRSRFEEEAGKEVEGNLDSLLKELPEDYLVALARGISGEYKLLTDVKRSIKRKDMAKAKNTYAKRFKEKDWQYAIKMAATEEELKAMVNLYSQRTREYFLEENKLFSEKTEKGQRVRYADRAKIASYIRSKLREYDDKTKPLAYAEAGKAIADYQMSVQAIAEAEKAAKEAEKDSGKKGKKK